MEVKYRYTTPDKVDALLTSKDFSHKAFGGELRIRKDDIQADKMIHLVFSILSAEATEPFTVVLDDVEEGQSNFVKAKKVGSGKQCYVTHLNVEKLLKEKALGGVDELPLKCKILKTEGEVECFTYKLKVVID